MHALDALLLGIVEGISEFLPISSTGHLILASRLLGIPDSAFLKSFEIAIQLGAILSVVVLYWRKLLLHKDTFLKVCTAFIPTAIIGLLVHDLAKTYLLGSTTIVLSARVDDGRALGAVPGGRLSHGLRTIAWRKNEKTK
jgi:undecaprenyl-diphosphatase